MMTPVTGRRLAWVGAGAVLVLGWLSGYALWHTEPFAEGFRTIPFAPAEAAGISGVALAGFLTAGILLRDATRWRTRFGWAALAGTTLVIGYALSFVWFGGFCLDPGDYCLTSWKARMLPAVGAGVALVTGALSCEWRRGKPTT